jgi:hypothetical protein
VDDLAHRDQVGGGQWLGEEAVEPVVGHLEDAADVRRAHGVEEQGSVWGVAVEGLLASPVAVEEVEGDESVEDVVDRPRL